MSTAYPGALDTLTNPTSSDTLNSPSHSAQHANSNDAIEAIEAKLGTGSSTATNNTVLRGTGSGSSAFAQAVLTTDVTGTLPVANGGTGVTASTGTVAVVLSTSPTLVSPILGTPTSGTLTNCTGLPVAGITASTSTALGVGSVELGHASDTTISRVSAGVVAVEGINLVDVSSSQTLSGKTLTAPKIANAGFIADANGNEQIIFNTTASAVNEVEITNADTGTTGPLIKASGETNVDLRLAGKGTGAIHATTGTYGDITADADGATVTFNLATSNVHGVTLGGNRTLALSNEHVGQIFTLRLLQDGTGSRTVTWFTTIKWAGGAAPTLTTTASKADTFVFIVTSAGNYDGYIVGQNV